LGDLAKEFHARFEAWQVSSHLWLVILVAFLIISAPVWWQGERAPEPGSVGMIQHAVALNDQGTFGYSVRENDVAKPAMFYAPLPAILIAGAMNLDENLAKSLRCVAWNTPTTSTNSGATQTCQPNYRPFFFVQALILTLVPFFAWLTAWLLSGHKAVAWGAVGLVLLSGRQAFYATSFSAEVLTLPLFATLVFALVTMVQSRYWLWTVVIGLTSGLLALSHPLFAWLYYGLLLVLCYWRAAEAQNSRYFWRTAAQLVAPYLLVTGPWMARNYLGFETSALTEGYIASILAERLTWNMMDGLELAVSFVYWLGGVGPELAAAGYPEDAWQRLVPGAAGGIHEASGSFTEATLTAAGSSANHLGYLVSEELWPNFAKHFGVTVAFMWRGLWVAGFWSLLTIPLTIAYGAVAISRRRTDIIMPLSACGYMLFLLAFISADLPRQSDIFIPLISALVAMLASEWLRHYQKAI
jgi:hypothetical protein